MRIEIILFSLVLALAQLPMRASASDTTSLATIIQGLRSYEAKLFQHTGEFQIRLKSRVSDITPAKGKILPIKWQLARKKDLWYTWACALHQPDSCAEIQIAKKGKLFEWRQDDRFCFVHNFDNGWNIFEHWGYFQRLGLNIYRYIAETNGIDYQALTSMDENRGEHAVVSRPMVPSCLEANAGKYLVHADKARIDDGFCWVVEYPGVDKLWIDPDKGFVVRKRIYHFGFGKPVWGAIHNSDYREIKPGLWVPFTQVEDRYATMSYHPQSLWGKVLQEVTYEVDDFSLSKVDESLFDPRVKPGVMVWDSSRNIEYPISDANADPFAGPISHGIAQRRWSKLLLALNIVMIVCLIAVLAWRGFWKRKHYGNA